MYRENIAAKNLEGARGASMKIKNENDWDGNEMEVKRHKFHSPTTSRSLVAIPV